VEGPAFSFKEITISTELVHKTSPLSGDRIASRFNEGLSDEPEQQSINNIMATVVYKYNFFNSLPSFNVFIQNTEECHKNDTNG
jgi:hypothetical protein